MRSSVYQRANGKWKADVALDDERRTKTFDKKSDAVLWQKENERDLLLNKRTRDALDQRNIVVTVAEALRRYAAEVSEFKKTGKKEKQRIRYFIDSLPNVDFPLVKYRAEYLVQYQDMVMKRSINPLSASSVLRDYSTLSAFFNWCRRDKGWIDFNPVESVRKPKKPVHRVRRIETDEVDKILTALNYVPGNVPTTKMQQVGLIWLIAMATGMRSGEIVGRKIQDVLLDRDCVILPDTKNGTSRVVPLDDYAKDLWTLALRIRRTNNSSKVFSVSDGSRDTLFRKARNVAKLDDADLTFHDSRHEAASVMAKRIKNALTLCKIFGWKDPKFALVYYNPTNDEIVDELNQNKFNPIYRKKVIKVTDDLKIA